MGCGRAIPIYEQKFESVIEDVVESVHNSYDAVQTILGNENKKRNERKSDIQRLKERIEREKDDDIKRELRMGHTVKIIEDATELAYLS